MPVVGDQDPAEQTQSLLDSRYRLGACVGRGATSAVYRAEDLILGRPVAIKLLTQSDEAPVSLQRVRTETAVLANLTHPSLVTLYDAQLEPGQPQYLAMEYVEGLSLASRLRGGALPDAEAASLLHDVADGLRVVHGAGVIHRDVKPSNILIAQPDEPGEHPVAKLTDFGIAFRVDDARRTSPGVAVGTAAYMAPEQVRGAELTTAVDIYALGLVLIEALSGEPAFPVTGGVHTALRRLTERPEIPDSFDDEWRALLERMTRTEPEERPTAREVAAEAATLETSASEDGGGRASSPRSDDPAPAGRSREAAGTAERTKEYPVATGTTVAPANRNRLRSTAAAGLAAVAVTLLVLAGLWQAPTATPEPAHPVTRMLDTPTPTAPAAAPGVQPAPEAETAAGTRQAAGQAKTGGSAPTNPNKGPAGDTGGNGGSGKKPNPNKGPAGDTGGNGGSGKKPNPNKGPGNDSGKGHGPRGG
ncbi:serine/threonine-protein kinase [Microbacterium sp. ARD32]|uniref:serine/threonine-protein kinase n=1 Tax=Microbacterium sp. ARD32 TaxID=2962577 RepID=UPI002882975F|nr:serine/threonine-protein kinase [Microbacterium sp. ARD32]MDT0158759.1 serine/threonine-protein kinase [Microbacterium sp. ARD32]